MSRYHISAYFERDGQIIDCSQGEVLGDAYGQVYPTLEEAQQVARELQDGLSETDLDPSTVYTIEPESEPMVDSDAGATAVLLRAAAGVDLAECDPALELQCMMFRSVASATDAEIFDLACTVAAKASKAVELRRVLGELEAEPDDEHTRPSIEPPATIKEPATHLLRAVWGNGTSELMPCRDGDSLVIGPEGALPTTMVPRTCYGGDAGVDVIVRGPEVPLVELLAFEQLQADALAHNRARTMHALDGAKLGERAALNQLIRTWGDEPARAENPQPEPSQAPAIGTPDVCLESVRKVCLSLLDQALEAVRLWPDPEAKTRLGRILPVLEDGLRRLAA